MPGVPRDTRRRIGLLGGSFNPAHDGHRHVSLEALKRLGLDEVWWLVSPQNPLKAGNGMEPLATRLARAKLIAHHPRIRVEAPELLLGTRYTLDTVRELNQLYPQAHFVWLMGADILPQLVDWQGWRELFAEIPIAAFARPGWRSEEHTSELQSQSNLVCRLLLEKKKKKESSYTLMTINQTNQLPPLS